MDELTDEEIEKYIPYRKEIQDILEEEGLAENRTNSAGEEQLVQVSTAEEVFTAGCRYVIGRMKQEGLL
jgi:hypothetical protein